MAGLGVVNVLDVARALGNEPLKCSPENAAEWLQREYLRRRGGSFNYLPAGNAAFDLFSGTATEESATLYCSVTGNPKGRSANSDAVKVIAPYALANRSRCYRIGSIAVAVGRIKGRTIYCAIRTSFVRVVGKSAFVVLPGFRMGHRPNEPEIDTACSIVLATLARDDYVGADFEYLYAGPGASGERSFRVIHGRNRRIYDADSVDQMLDIYTKAVALIHESGVEIRDPNLKGYRILDPNEPRFI